MLPLVLQLLSLSVLDIFGHSGPAKQQAFGADYGRSRRVVTRSHTNRHRRRRARDSPPIGGALRVIYEDALRTGEGAEHGGGGAG
jgi:hypothetical protein